MKKIHYIDQNDGNNDIQKEKRKKKLNDKLRKKSMHYAYDPELAKYYGHDRRPTKKYKRSKEKNKFNDYE